MGWDISESTSKVTSKFQATIPQPVREKLGLQKGDRVVFEEEGDRIFLRKVETLDLAYLEAVSTTLEEWASEVDEVAYRDL